MVSEWVGSSAIFKMPKAILALPIVVLLGLALALPMLAEPVTAHPCAVDRLVALGFGVAVCNEPGVGPLCVYAYQDTDASGNFTHGGDFKLGNCIVS